MTKGFIYMFILFAYIVGSISGIAYPLWCGAWPNAIACTLLAVMAFPTAKKVFHEWIAL